MYLSPTPLPLMPPPVSSARLLGYLAIRRDGYNLIIEAELWADQIAYPTQDGLCHVTIGCAASRASTYLNSATDAASRALSTIILEEAQAAAKERLSTTTPMRVPLRWELTLAEKLNAPIHVVKYDDYFSGHLSYFSLGAKEWCLGLKDDNGVVEISLPCNLLFEGKKIRVLWCEEEFELISNC